MQLFGFFLILTLFEGSTPVKNYPRDCAPIKLRFGRVRYRQRGKIARFLCNTGYILAGDRYNVCVQGHWDNNSFPKCVRATCQQAKPPANGLMYPSHSGAVLEFYCKPDYQLIGANVTYCDGTRWDNPLPSCLPSNSTPPLGCDFETPDLCGWNHDLNHDFDWTRHNYDTPSGNIGTGPAHDHTKGPNEDGYYMYIESSARNTDDKARLISPIFEKSEENVCFEFYYHMYGVSTGILRLYLKKMNDTWELKPETALWTKKGNQGNHWFRGFVKFGPINDDYQVVIEGVRGNSYVSDIAIDDVRLIPNCSPDDEEAETTTTMAESTTETPITVESCENRCDSTDNRTSDWLITCDCDDGCFERSRCCPDYFDFCLLGTTDDMVFETTTTTEATTSERAEITRVLIVKETEVITDYKSDKSDKVFDHQKIVVESKTAESNTKSIVFGVGVVFGVLFSAVGTAFVAKRYQLCRCRKLNQSSNGDSQSDVRFLTCDEALDFTLATDYDSS